MLQTVKNIYNLGIKEIRGLLKDWLMVVLIVYSFTLGIYIACDVDKENVSNAAIAVVDEDNSQLSKRIIDSLLPPHFLPPASITMPEIDPLMDRGDYTFVMVIPQNFQKDTEAGNGPVIQLNVDATRMGQAFTGTGYIQEIVASEVAKFGNIFSAKTDATVLIRNRFNANLTSFWNDSIMQLISNITMLAIILTGAALIRERENGTLEHLLVMPVTPFEIMVSKIWSMSFVVLISTGLSLLFVIKGYMKVPVEGSFLLFMAGVALHLFAVTSMGIFLACVAQNMPQLGMLLILVLIPMQMLSGGMTPQESMPEFVQNIMKLAPTTHFVTFSSGILFRGAGFDVVWKPFLCLFLIGSVLFAYSMTCFRKSLA